ncbi:MAG: hypothetical protein QOI38_2466, partial [Sphingomonadales bacterium]|nr:hypothetical protein [Sphingomonadales bacterium]
EFGSADDRQSRLLIQLVTSIATRAVMPLAAGNDVDIGGKELANLARAIKDITSAAKTDVDREKTIRAEEAKKVREAAAAAAETEAKAAGASEESIRRVRAAILGLKS